MASILQIARTSSQVSPLLPSEGISKEINITAKKEDSKWIDITAKEDLPVSQGNENDIVRTPPSESNYFSFFDDTPLSFFEDDVEEKDTQYEIFTDNLHVSAANVPYVLEQIRFEENHLVDTKRFTDDIIFMLLHDDHRILECSTVGLVLGIIGSLYLLPPGFDVSAALLLSAPLFVSVCGLFAKRFKRR